jgi:hypothetical protein
VRADLDQVADLVSGDARPGGWLDTQTGDCLSENDRAAMDEEFRPDVEDEHRWVWLNCTGPQSRWRDRYEFAQALRPGPLRDSLLVALDGSERSDASPECWTANRSCSPSGGHSQRSGTEVGLAPPCSGRATSRRPP